MTWLRRVPWMAAGAIATAGCVVERNADIGPPAYRLVSANRAHTGESHLSARIKFGAGQFQLSPADGILYRASLNYDERRFTPVMAYDPADGDLEIGIGAANIRGNMHLSEQRLDVALGTGVPLELTLELGASESTLELGGLLLTDVTLATGASKTTGTFSTPNPGVCDAFTVQVGAAELTLTGLANSRCQRFDVAGGAGEFTFDFTGSWGELTEVDIALKMGVGEVTLVFPEDVGVSITMDKFLVGFSGSRFRQEGRRRTSANYDSASVRIGVQVSAALGSLNVRWVPAAQ